MKDVKAYVVAAKAREKLLWAIIQCQRIHETFVAQSGSNLGFFTGCGCTACDARRAISDAIEILDK